MWILQQYVLTLYTCLTLSLSLLAQLLARRKDELSNFTSPPPSLPPRSYCTRITELLKFVVHEKDESKYFDILYQKCQEKSLRCRAEFRSRLSAAFITPCKRKGRWIAKRENQFLPASKNFVHIRTRYSKHVKETRAIRSNSRNWKRT